ncbi:DUF4203 domain-containing protein [Nocardioides euryhalodurans]|uniref:TMEM198/TM7SF3 family protein n=1 Tax=Nocardioides euryhalodurans TaxID=2518370 RepID=A0A4P7GHC0_9ACTN|nr:DUF4203 domain-containing protein [Nocardioides euryhalodurans]QBR91131.1 TMEM198/TM7SF3 family protein [Nocardioides euryhalodurans]
MSATVLIALGAVLCFLGARFLRVTILVAGFGLGWMLTELFDADLQTQVLVALGAAVTAFVVTLVIRSILLFVAGAVVGAVIGARVYALLAGGEGDPDLVLGLVFVPTIALLGGFLGDRYQRRLLVWGTAVAGAAMILSGVGRAGSSSTELFWRPQTTWGTAVFLVAWVGLALVGQRFQHRDDTEDAR